MDLTLLVNEFRGFSFEKEWFEFKETSIMVIVPFTRVEKRSTKNEAAAAQYVPLTAKEVLCNHHDNLPINLLTCQSTC